MTVALVPAVLLILGTLSGARAAGEDGKALFNEKCGICHSTRISTSRHDTKEGWKTVVRSMQSKKSNWISDAQAEKIVEYLAKEYGKK